MGVKWPKFQFAGHHPNLVFWVSFCALNLLLFLPAYLLDAETSTLLPTLAAGDLWATSERFLIWRNNLDPFRLSLELTLVGVLWLTVRWV